MTIRWDRFAFFALFVSLTWMIRLRENEPLLSGRRSNEDARVIFLHYWGIGSAHELARTFKRALDTQK